MEEEGNLLMPIVLIIVVVIVIVVAVVLVKMRGGPATLPPEAQIDIESLEKEYDPSAGRTSDYGEEYDPSPKYRGGE